MTSLAIRLLPKGAPSQLTDPLFTLVLTVHDLTGLEVEALRDGPLVQGSKVVTMDFSLSYSHQDPGRQSPVGKIFHILLEGFLRGP